jgi:ABC-type glycerol-3-phosphate transport system permease component
MASPGGTVPLCERGTSGLATTAPQPSAPLGGRLANVQWNLTMAATLLVMLPVVALFFAAQKAFAEGVTLTGVRG